MMFALRGMAIALALFFLAYCSFSLLVVCGSRWLVKLSELTPRISARLLIAARMFPLALAVGATLLVTVPSFIFMEPRGREEGIGLAAALAALGGAAVVVAGLSRALHALRSTERVLASWLPASRALDLGAHTSTFEVAGAVPPLTLAGVCRPRLLLADSVLALLSPQELKSAVRHEMAHVRSGDNLKKLAVRAAWFPGMGKLERAWQRAAEMAADDAAVSSAAEALDLAAALIKLSRKIPARPLPAISMGLVQDGFVGLRVSRLLHWNQNSHRLAAKLHWLIAAAACMAIVMAATAYGPLLTQVHTLTEWLVR